MGLCFPQVVRSAQAAGRPLTFVSELSADGDVGTKDLPHWFGLFLDLFPC